jgi:hypothetical protein
MSAPDAGPDGAGGAAGAAAARAAAPDSAASATAAPAPNGFHMLIAPLVEVAPGRTSPRPVRAVVMGGPGLGPVS